MEILELREKWLWTRRADNFNDEIQLANHKFFVKTGPGANYYETIKPANIRTTGDRIRSPPHVARADAQIRARIKTLEASSKKP